MTFESYDIQANLRNVSNVSTFQLECDCSMKENQPQIWKRVESNLLREVVSVLRLVALSSKRWHCTRTRSRSPSKGSEDEESFRKKLCPRSFHE